MAAKSIKIRGWNGIFWPSTTRCHHHQWYSLSLSIAVATPLFALNLGGSILPWDHPIVIAIFCLVPFGFGLFYFVESRMATLPIIPMHFLRMPTAIAVMSCAFPIVFAFNQVFL